MKMQNMLQLSHQLLVLSTENLLQTNQLLLKLEASIGKGDVLCVIEAMKLFNEIESEISGKIVKILSGRYVSS